MPFSYFGETHPALECRDIQIGFWIDWGMAFVIESVASNEQNLEKNNAQHHQNNLDLIELLFSSATWSFFSANDDVTELQLIHWWIVIEHILIERDQLKIARKCRKALTWNTSVLLGATICTRTQHAFPPIAWCHERRRNELGDTADLRVTPRRQFTPHCVDHWIDAGGSRDGIATFVPSAKNYISNKL